MTMSHEALVNKKINDAVREYTVCYTFIDPRQCSAYAMIREPRRDGVDGFKMAMKENGWDTNQKLVAIECTDEKEIKHLASVCKSTEAEVSTYVPFHFSPEPLCFVRILIPNAVFQ